MKLIDVRLTYAYRRRSLRLPEYDYSQPGAYFITIVVKDRLSLLGQIENGEMQPTPMGILVESEWQKLPKRFPHISIDCFVVMPNHVHGVIVIEEEQQQTAPGLGQMVGYFKDQTTKGINRLRGTPGQPFWQHDYYEHVIRDEQDFRRIWDYITHNPALWEKDRLYS